MKFPKLVILDRDGVLNYHSKDPASPLYYVTKLEHVVIKPGVKEAISLLLAHGIYCVIATRQRCISKGLATIEQVKKVNDDVIDSMGLFPCPCLIEPEAADKTALFKQIIERYKLPPAEIFLFDDSNTELEAARAFGITAHDGTDLLCEVKEVLGVS